MVRKLRKDEVHDRLVRQIERGGELLRISIYSDNSYEDVYDQYCSWSEHNEALIKAAFETEDQFKMYSSEILVGAIGGTENYREAARELERKIKEKIRKLGVILELLELYEDQGTAVKAPEPLHSTGNTIFLVHGRDKAVTQEVARTIRTLTNLDPTLLCEGPNAGQTIIEKLESVVKSARFAVVLFTADDVGRLATDTVERKRARQNVVFELGLFMGRLGRNRTCVLLDSDVEIFSDIAGLGYIQIAPGAEWILSLSKELNAAGIKSDANRI